MIAEADLYWLLA